MSLTTRTQLIDLNDTVQLTAQFTNQAGIPINLDMFPSISIVSPSGLVIMPPTSAGVLQIDVGKYQFNFTIPYNGPFGIWADNWMGTYQGNLLANSFEFIVVSTDVPRFANTDGYASLGDDPGFNYSQLAITNINKLIKTLRARLNSRGKAKSVDSYGNVIYVDCDIFSVDMLVAFLGNALSDFNQIPFFTFFSFEETQIIDQFHDILVEGATLMALASQALIERGRAYQINDNGVNFTPPDVSEMIQTQYNTLLSNYYDKIKFIKASMRPNPISLGVMSMMNAARNPAIARLRALRARQII